MPEAVPGNGQLPEGQQPELAHPETQRREEMLAEMEAFLAQRNVAPPAVQATPPHSARALISMSPPPGKAGPQPTPPPEPSSEVDTLLDDPSLRLLMRFLVGAAIVGAEELLTRVRRWDEKAPQVPPVAAGEAFGEATNLELVRYLAIGSLVWGRRWLVRTIRTNVIGSAGKPSPLLQSVDRITGVWPLSSFRGPLEQAKVTFAAAVQQRIQEGWREEQAARWLAGQTIEEIFDDVIDYISENPQLAALVRDQIGRQSIGLATTVRDTGRDWSMAGDDIVEAVVRRVFRRRPRSEVTDPPAVIESDVEDGRG